MVDTTRTYCPEILRIKIMTAVSQTMETAVTQTMETVRLAKNRIERKFYFSDYSIELFVSV